MPKKMQILFTVFIICTILFSTLNCRAGGGIDDVENEKALKIIADTNSSFYDFYPAIKQLGSIKGDPQFWLKIAADEHYAPNRRRECVKHFFINFASAGMRFDEVTKLIGTNVNWISFGQIKKEVRGEFMAGWAPDASMKGNSEFSLPILSDKDGDYHLVIFLSFQENVAGGDFLSAIKNGRENTAAAAKMTIAGRVSWDSDEWESRYPGRQWIW